MCCPGRGRTSDRNRGAEELGREFIFSQLEVFDRGHRACLVRRQTSPDLRLLVWCEVDCAEQEGQREATIVADHLVNSGSHRRPMRCPRLRPGRARGSADEHQDTHGNFEDRAHSLLHGSFPSKRAPNEGPEHHPELVRAYGVCVHQSALLHSDRLCSSPNTVPILRAIVTRSPTGSTLFLLDTASTIGTRSIRLPFSATMDP